jgi:hypothetical protein
MKSYFRRVFTDRRVALGRYKRGGWGLIFKRIVKEGVEPDVVQTLVKRKGRSVMTTSVRISDEAMEELVYLYKKHPERSRTTYKFTVEADALKGKWELTGPPEKIDEED